MIEKLNCIDAVIGLPAKFSMEPDSDLCAGAA
jgi:hypothetical protein